MFCKLAAGSSPASHKGYGFIEYSTNQAALESIASMNLFDLGGQLLRVGRAITPPNALISPAVNSSMPTAAAVAVRLGIIKHLQFSNEFLNFFRPQQQRQRFKRWMQYKQMFSESQHHLWDSVHYQVPHQLLTRSHKHQQFHHPAYFQLLSFSNLMLPLPLQQQLPLHPGRPKACMSPVKSL